MLFGISVLDDNQRGPRYVRQLLDSIHQSNPNRLPITLHYSRHQQTVGLFCRCPESLGRMIADDLQSLYDGSEVVVVDDRALDLPDDHTAWSMALRIDPDIFAITQTEQFDDLLQREFVDPITGILSRVGNQELWSRIDLTIRPAANPRCRQARRIADVLDRPCFQRRVELAHWFARRMTSEKRRWRWPANVVRRLLSMVLRPVEHQPTNEKTRGHHLFEATLRLLVAAPDNRSDRAHQQLQSLAGAFAVFSQPQRVRWQLSTIRSDTAQLPRPFLLSSDEAAQLWHPVTQCVGAASLAMNESRQLEPSADLSSREREAGDIVLGVTTFRRQRQPVWIGCQDRLRHVLVIGRTGTGKSTLISNMFVDDMRAGHGCCLIDPHGDLFDNVLQFVPANRHQDLVICDPASCDSSLVLNVLQCAEPENSVLVADAVLSAFKKIFGLDEQHTPRLISILRNSLLTLIGNPNATLADIPRLLTDESFRNRAVRKVGNPIVQDYWLKRFSQWPKSERTKAVESTLNKVDTFTTSPILQPIFGQPRSTINLREAMDSGKILLANLSKGRIGEDASNMLGSLLVTKLQLDAMSRGDSPEESRRPFFTYIDEFQNFATESFATILSEARKYGLGLTMGRIQVYGNVIREVSLARCPPTVQQVASKPPPQAGVSGTQLQLFE